MADTVAKRSEIPQEKRWAVEDLYPCDAAWEEDYQRVAALIGEGEKYKGHLGDSAQTLQEYLDFADQLDQEIEKIYMYAHLNMDVDTTDVTYQTMRMKAQTLLVRAEEENAAFASGEVPVKDYDDHAVHIERHTAYLLSGRCPAGEEEQVEAHIALHKDKSKEEK